tara:strand:- start:338 stop:649 length:312 start_codon:yes stop_codon:yes gene_type:complete
MAERYKHKNITKDTKTGKPYLLTTINPTIPLDNSDLIVFTKLGDRLDILANRYYKNPTYWWVIAEANGLGKASYHIPPGFRLRIPGNLASVSNKQDEINNRRK